MNRLHHGVHHGGGLLLAFALLFLFAGHRAHAQTRKRFTPVTLSASVLPAQAKPGDVVTVTVSARIAPTYHMYSIVPVPPPGPLATTVSITAPGLSPTEPLTESAAIRKLDSNFEKEVGYHENAAQFTQKMTVTAKAANGVLPLAISVRYMACDAKSCLPPMTVTVNAPSLQITGGVSGGPGSAAAVGAVPSAAVATDIGAPPPAAPASVLDANAADGAAGDSLLAFILQAFGAGLLALLTPCVFPLVPVTLAFFTKQATSGAGVVKLAAVYSLGIVAAFTGIGAVLAGVIGASGAQQVAANPWVNLIFAALFVVFGLSLLEIMEIRLPGSLQNLTRPGNRAGGTLGVLVMGLTFVIAAFTCTAPFIGTVLVAASTAASGAQWVRPIVGMMAFSTALALPFFLLALFPALLARLPRSGAWLATVKGAMGWVELAAALKFLSNADLVWQWKLITQPVLLAAWVVLSLAAALWLLGVLRIGFGAPSDTPTPARRVWSGVFVAAALYCLWGLTGRPLDAQTVAFLPPADYGGAISHATGDIEDLRFLPTLEAALAQAKAENKPIFIDFTGYTCTNCRWMEKNVFPDPTVQKELGQFIRVRLYTDGGTDGDKNQTYQEKTFGDVALPLYALLDPAGKPLVKSAGITRDPQKFAAFLRKGRGQMEARAVRKIGAGL